MEWILVFLMTVKQPDGTVRHNVPVTANVPTDIDTCQAQLKMLRKSKTRAECWPVDRLQQAQQR